MRVHCAPAAYLPVRHAAEFQALLQRQRACGSMSTRGCTQEMRTVPSTWSMDPSMRWTLCDWIRLDTIGYDWV